MSEINDLFEELQSELEAGSETLGELFQQAVEEPSSAPDVVVELFQEAQERGQSLGELFQETGQDFFEELSDGDLQLVDDELFLDLDGQELLLDPTDEEFLNQLDVFGVGESIGLIPSSDDE